MQKREIITLIPVVNYVFFIIFAGNIVTPESVDSLLSTIALVSALMISISVGGLMSVSFDELTQADERYTTGIYECANLNNFGIKHPSVVLAQNSLDSMYMLGLALMGSAVLLISAKYVETKTHEGDTAETSPEFRRWWSIVRFPVLAIIVFLVVGVMYMFFAVRETVVVKFPNYYLQEACSANRTNVWAADIETKDTNPIYSTLFWVILVLCFLLTTISAAGYAMGAPPPCISRNQVADVKIRKVIPK
eukprot:m.469344 g.469344  ORF g.469344 m.469344 type:complete len:249 (-) comp28424_c0_seq1:364-1110(-)